MQAGKEVRARALSRALLDCYRLSGTWFYVDISVFSKELCGPGTVKTFVVFAFHSFPFLIWGTMFPLL